MRKTSIDIKPIVYISAYGNKGLINNPFHPMKNAPRQATDLKGNLEDFSETVLLYDEGLDIWTLGWYNYDTNDWNHHMEESMEFICWCYPPDPAEFISKNKLEKVKCQGYRD